MSTPYLGGYSAEVPPLPIPNRVVKLSIADGTALRCGRVGSRHFERVPLGTLFFLRLRYSPQLVRTEGTDVYCLRCAGEIIVPLWLQSFGRIKVCIPLQFPFLIIDGNSS